jgi:hypothetical protein
MEGKTMAGFTLRTIFEELNDYELTNAELDRERAALQSRLSKIQRLSHRLFVLNKLSNKTSK